MPIGVDVQLADDVVIFYPDLVNLYGCTINSETKIGTFVEIQKNVVVGARCHRGKFSSHELIFAGECGKKRFMHKMGSTKDLIPGKIGVLV